MGARIEWPGGRLGVIRFGPQHQRAENRDPYRGCGVLEDLGRGLCLIGPIRGEFTPDDHQAILEACLRAGFRRARVERRGKLWEYQLTEKPYRRILVENQETEP